MYRPRFIRDRSFLSNFYRSPIVVDGIKYPTVEHAFQAQKSENHGDRLEISLLKTPTEAKIAGRRVKLRPDWEQVKIGAMRECLLAKFSDPTLMVQLLAIDDEEIVEWNTWGDTVWGMCVRSGKGQNLLGKLLTEIRNSAKAQV